MLGTSFSRGHTRREDLRQGGRLLADCLLSQTEVCCNQLRPKFGRGNNLRFMSLATICTSPSPTSSQKIFPLSAVENMSPMAETINTFLSVPINQVQSAVNLSEILRLKFIAKSSMLISILFFCPRDLLTQLLLYCFVNKCHASCTNAFTRKIERAIFVYNVVCWIS
jgi:hypothetical protein